MIFFVHSQFGQFDYSQGYSSEQPYTASPTNMYTGSIMTPDTNAAYTSPSSSDGYEDEPPLLEGKKQWSHWLADLCEFIGNKCIVQ